MSVLHWIVEEARSILLVTLYFAGCFGVVMILKQLLLEEYGVEFRGLSIALFAALATAKVVVVLEKVPLSRWLRRQVVIADVIARSVIYTFATLLVLLLEKAIESHAEHGSVALAIANVFEHREVHQVWATTIVVGLAFIAFNAYRAIHRELGGQRLAEIFLSKSTPANIFKGET